MAKFINILFILTFSINSNSQSLTDKTFVIEKLTFNEYVELRNITLQEAYSQGKIDSINLTATFDNKDYKSLEDSYEELLTELNKYGIQFKELTKTESINIQESTDNNNLYLIRPDLYVLQFPKGGLALTITFNLLNPDNELIISEGPKRLIKRIRKEKYAP